MVTTYRFAGNLPATPDLIARARRRVRHLEAVGLSRRAIAAKAGVSPMSVTNLMQPSPRISKPIASKLAEVR
jgi:DNA-binding CsgD family transcriptional regulator